MNEPEGDAWDVLEPLIGTVEAPANRSSKIQPEINALADLPAAQIKTNDIPEVRGWRDAKRGVLHRL